MGHLARDSRPTARQTITDPAPACSLPGRLTAGALSSRTPCAAQRCFRRYRNALWTANLQQTYRTCALQNYVTNPCGLHLELPVLAFLLVLAKKKASVLFSLYQRLSILRHARLPVFLSASEPRQSCDEPSSLCAPCPHIIQRFGERLPATRLLDICSSSETAITGISLDYAERSALTTILTSPVRPAPAHILLNQLA